MDAKKNPYQYNHEYYVQGSTARKLERVQSAGAKSQAAPARRTAYPEPDQRQPQRREPVRRNVQKREADRYERLWREEQKQEEKKLVQIGRGINFFGMLMLSIAIVSTVYCCVTYLNLQAENGRLDKSIAALQAELATATDANLALEESIVGSVDLDAIYQAAVAELGMVFPNNNEVINYASVDTSYVRQYADIKEAAKSVLEGLIP